MGPWHSSLLGGVHLSRDDAPLAPPCPWARFPAWSMLRPKRDVAAQLLGAEPFRGEGVAGLVRRTHRTAGAWGRAPPRERGT